MLEYHSIAAITALAEEKNLSVSELVLADQAEAMEQSAETLFAAMKKNLDVMRDSAAAGAASSEKSHSGLSGGNGRKMTSYAEGESVSGGFCAKAMARAISIAEYNAGMGRIVAAPTAGSCGILPAALLTAEEIFGIPEDRLVMSLFTAGAFGMVIAQEASIAGAEGGCQAECGSAAAIAAAALVELRGGTPTQTADACAIAIKNQLGLVCDPVAGLVEVPCIKRNAGGVMCAIAAADMALAGIKSAIPIDEVIGAMREVGDAMSGTLKETAQGGLAATPTGRAIAQSIENSR